MKGTTSMAPCILKLGTCGHLLYLAALPPQNNPALCLISGFCCTLSGYYTGYSGNSLLTFRYSPSIPTARVKNSFRISLCWVISQQKADLNPDTYWRAGCSNPKLDYMVLENRKPFPPSTIWGPDCTVCSLLLHILQYPNSGNDKVIQ